jgi:hypothetical protein
MNYVFQVKTLATINGMLFLEVKKALMRFLKTNCAAIPFLCCTQYYLSDIDSISMVYFYSGCSKTAELLFLCYKVYERT